MEIATTEVESSFNEIMCKQIDGVTVGSLLGLTLAHIFVGFYKTKLFSNANKPHIYHRYVDDTFVAFNIEKE